MSTLLLSKTKFYFVTFYQFATLEQKEITAIQESIYTQFSQNLLGLIILAEEGINGTVSGSQEAITRFVNYLNSLEQFSTFECKYSEARLKRVPFRRLKIKIKAEIVTMGLPVNTAKFKGKYVEPENWNTFIENNKDILLLDVRNVYEYRIGSFKNALDSKILHFRYFPSAIKNIMQKQRPSKIAMFCTGGIRCEKASAYIQQNFPDSEVYQLHGGILKYFEKLQKSQSLWTGKCFVFDGRITVNQNLEAEPQPLCPVCGQVMLPKNNSPDYLCYQCIEYPRSS